MTERQNCVDKNITALNDCLQKFVNLMSSVPQSLKCMRNNSNRACCFNTNCFQPTYTYATQQELRSKIFEHKKALRNVSKEMDQKLIIYIIILLVHVSSVCCVDPHEK
eukprot:550825_1